MNRKQHLMIEHLDKKLTGINSIGDVPAKGWVFTIRTAIKMSLRQLADRLNITPPSAKDIEYREKDGSITLKALREAARAMNMKLVYALVPLDGSLEIMIEKRAREIAEQIVSRTAHSMKLEDQAVSYKRIDKSVKEMAAEIKNEMPRYLWD
jgi:predicted DNA-binding mobile mystery protein A